MVEKVGRIGIKKRTYFIFYSDTCKSVEDIDMVSFRTPCS
jgi:hypothetical protein